MKEYCGKFNDECRERVRDKYDRTCFVCNVREDRDARRLSVHHVDKNRDQGCDNIDWKLVPLCASCHAKAHHEPLMSRIGYLLIHEKDILITTYNLQVYMTQEEYDIEKHCTHETHAIHEYTDAMKRILDAINAGMRHIDSIALFADTSDAYCRRVCNELADEGEIQKIVGRAHHTYLPKEEED